MKRLTTLFAIAALAIFSISQSSAAVSAANREALSQPADSAAWTERLQQLNSGWCERVPDLSQLGDDYLIHDETSAIQAHLLLVVEVLKQADTAHLSREQIANRVRHIERLERYRAAGRFPQNVLVSGYRPVFIDPWGTHCAVGYLIAESGAPQLAATINQEHRLDFLSDIKTSGLAAWQVASGLSAEELALIQPSYISKTLTYPSEIESLILGDSEKVIAAVEEDPSLLNARCGGKTLLHFAAAAGDLDLVKWLVEKGADLHALSESSFESVAPPQKREDPFGNLIRPRSSSTLYEVRWNESTKVAPHRGGGLRMGTLGAVFQTQRGTKVAGILQDFRGGVSNQNALYFATVGVNGFLSAGLSKAAVSTEPSEIDELNTDRKAVAQWLKTQGLK